MLTQGSESSGDEEKEVVVGDRRDLVWQQPWDSKRGEAAAKVEDGVKRRRGGEWRLLGEQQDDRRVREKREPSADDDGGGGARRCDKQAHARAMEGRSAPGAEVVVPAARHRVTPRAFVSRRVLGPAWCHLWRAVFSV